MTFRPLLALVLAALPSLRSAADPGDIAPALPAIPAAQFDLTDFGAQADGRTDNQEAFRRAVAAVKASGGGHLNVPAGVYFTGPIDLCARCDLHLAAGARLLFSQNFADYRRDKGRPRPMIGADQADDVMISGSGAIDGQGSPWWVVERRAKSEARARGLHDAEIGRPHLVVFTHGRRVRLEGITLTNSAMYNFVPTLCQDVTVEGITIQEPADSPNTDGIDPSASERVRIAHCHIFNGDDCIAIKAKAGPSRDILVTDCDFHGGHGCSIGSDTLGGVSRMLVRRCTFDDMTVGVRLKSARDRGGLVEDVVYRDLVMRNVAEAIVITSYYYDLPKLGRHDPAQPVTAETPHWRRITVRQVTAVAGIRSAGMIVGLAEAPAADITLSDVTLRAQTGLRLSYVQGVTLERTKIDPGRGPPLLIGDSVQGLAR